MQLTPQVGASLLAAALASGISVFAWRRRDVPAVPALVAFNVGIVVWTGGNALQAAATTKAAKLLWVNVQYVGIATIPVSGFAFAAEFTGHEELATRRKVALLAAPMVALVLLSWTNPWHGLVRTSATVTWNGGVATLERSFGPVFWLGWLYSQVVLLAPSVLVLRSVLYTRDLYRRQVAALAVGALVPWAAQILFLTGVSPVEPEVFFSVTGAAFVYAVTRFRFLDLVPVARDALLEMLDEGVVVFDGDDRVVDHNTAAGRALPDLAVGATAEAVFAAHPGLLDVYRAGEDADVDVETADGARRYSVQVTALPERAGRALVLHDVTELAEREAELQRKNRRLEEFSGVVSHDLRSPLSVATGYVDLEREERDSERLRRVAEALDRIDGIIEDLLTLAREEDEVTTRPVSLDEVARSAWRHVEADVDVDASAELVAETGARVAADRDLLLRALENVVENAVEHGDASAVRVERTDEGFAVADDGTGFHGDPDDVFEWGETAADTGSGIGLAIVRRVAEAHGWTVTASEDDGARVEFGSVTVAPEGTVDGAEQPDGTDDGPGPSGEAADSSER